MGWFDDWEEVQTPEEEAADRQERRELLAYLLANSPREPRRFGIHGFEVCQQCGEIGSYNGFWSAIGSHGGSGIRDKDHPIPPGAFIGGRCHDPSDTPPHPRRRFCELCRDPVLLENADRVSYMFLCADCSSAIRKFGSGEELRTMIERFTRFRWRYHGLIEEEPWDRGRYW